MLYAVKATSTRQRAFFSTLAIVFFLFLVALFSPWAARPASASTNPRLARHPQPLTSPSKVLPHAPTQPYTLYGPEDITAGPDGSLWFTEHDGNKIGRI